MTAPSGTHLRGLTSSAPARSRRGASVDGEVQRRRRRWPGSGGKARQGARSHCRTGGRSSGSRGSRRCVVSLMRVDVLTHTIHCHCGDEVPTLGTQAHFGRVSAMRPGLSSAGPAGGRVVRRGKPQRAQRRPDGDTERASSGLSRENTATD